MCVVELLQFDYYVLFFCVYDIDLMMLLLLMQLLFDMLLVNVLVYVQGDILCVLQGMCVDILIGCCLVGCGDNLLFSMIGVVLLEGQVYLFVDLLVELFVDVVLLLVCMVVLQFMIVFEQSLCMVMCGEFVMGQVVLCIFEQGSVLQLLVFNLVWIEVCFVFYYVWVCDVVVMQVLVDDWLLCELVLQLVGFDCVVNVLGCCLVVIGVMMM